MSQLKFSQADRATRQLTNEYIRNLQGAYSQALLEVRETLGRTSANYGALDLENMSKMRTVTLKSGAKARMTRLQALERELLSEIGKLNAGDQQRLAGHLTEVYTKNYEIGAQNISNVLRRDISFNMMNREAIYQSAINPIAKLSMQANHENAKLQIRQAVTQGIVQGESIPKISKRIQKSLEKTANDAVRIARTETTGVQNQARQELLKDAIEKGIQAKKVWISTNDDRTRTFEKTGGRADHSIMNGETVEYNKEFSNGLMFPGDKEGDASEVINCRCTMGYEIE